MKIVRDLMKMARSLFKIEGLDSCKGACGMATPTTREESVKSSKIKCVKRKTLFEFNKIIII